MTMAETASRKAPVLLVQKFQIAVMIFFMSVLFGIIAFKQLHCLSSFVELLRYNPERQNIKRRIFLLQIFFQNTGRKYLW